MKTLIFNIANALSSKFMGWNFIPNDNVFKLSDRDAEIFFNELEINSEPNVALKDAAIAYMKEITDIEREDG